MKYKYLLFILALYLKMTGLSQSKSFELIGYLKGVDSGFVQFHYHIPDSTFNIKDDRVHLLKGKFIIKGKIPFPSQAYLSVISRDKIIESRYFFIDSGKQNLMLEVINENLVVTSTGKSYNEYLFFKSQIDSFDRIENDIHQWFDSIINNLNENKSNNYNDSFLVLKRNNNILKDSFILKHFKTYPDSYAGLSQLWRLIYFNGYSPVYDSAFLYLGRDLKLIREGREVYKMLENTRQFVIGSKFPTFELMDTGKIKIFLSQMHLKEYTLLDFWFHSCGACLLEFPGMKEIYRKWQNRGFEILGISTDLSRFENEWKRAITKIDLPWPQYWDRDHLQASDLLINFFPTNYLINKSGVILAKNINNKDLDKFLETNLK